MSAGFVKSARVGLIVFVAYIVALFISAFIVGLLYTFIPFLPTLYLPIVGDLLSFVILIVILGILVIYLMRFA